MGGGGGGGGRFSEKKIKKSKTQFSRKKNIQDSTG